ncbi:MAG TPA: UDP-N-acetylmuramoyl-tripeptide--D-alanyl-D-alanine ligase [candidate division WOR-3 bacterium]|uniref:UDP-N-acetylmuramoyl-tripeptide--D-alanyl-D-alanine ligase n=1 Tax=candidate division WOR-3 bacterium TaxID=2052148 RepID=A0A7C1BDT4_UNCW3|nr:UDP-N-acetylmuramoyl-tripeptide--D-alanyl-D-alanine ligase [candidate division WOR-3 bacterium]
MRYRLRDVAEIVEGVLLSGDPSAPVAGISTDSRTIEKGELFFALEGENFDGVYFVKDALKKGACGAVVPQSYQGPGPIIKVEDTLKALGKLAAHYRSHLKNTRVIGITGSVGKTTTKELLAHVLEARFSVKKSPKSFNNLVGVPLTLFSADPQTEFLVAEAGISKIGEMEKLAEILRPDIAILTRVGRAHVGYLRSTETIAREKSRLFEKLGRGGFAVVNAESPHYEIFVESVPEGRDVILYGLESGDFKPERYVLSGEGTEFVVEGHRYWLPRPGPGNLENALAVLLVALRLGMDPEEIAERFSSFQGPPMRMQRRKVGPFEVVNDAYNANPDSMAELFRAFPETNSERNIFVLGDMLELGEEAERLHRETGRVFAETGHRILIAIGPLARELARGAREAGADRVFSFLDLEEALEFLREFLRPGDRILLKASRLMEFEKIERALEEF